MKKIIVACLCMVVLMSACFSASAAIMYSGDGSSIWVDDGEITYYEEQGWYWGKPTEVYPKGYGKSWWERSFDEKTYYDPVIIGENRVYEYELNGWTWGEPTEMHASDGRTIIVGLNRVPAYEAVGWYWGEPTTIYNMYGETMIVGKSRISEYKAWGWEEEPFVEMYSLDGRKILVSQDDVFDYEQVGWFNGAPVLVWNLQGESQYIGSEDLAFYRFKGYYTFEPIKLYAPDGRTTVVDKNELNAWIAVGWSATEYAEDNNYDDGVYEDCTNCIGGRETCPVCMGSGRITDYIYTPILGYRATTARCNMKGCVNGTIKCTNSKCKGGKIRVN